MEKFLTSLRACFTGQHRNIEAQQMGARLSDLAEPGPPLGEKSSSRDLAIFLAGFAGLAVGAGKEFGDYMGIWDGFASYRDFLADIVGVTLGVGAALCFPRDW
eukprot:CAMPEP_0196598896 /NCGR_PEP_ID=MMETSP1081-20130531/94569_1 /TAXON_ID=36882 /ORGANISM="Pyramimonas amylifera, Strain CCMP720" /LENGTH=102 /DNA_ID=CAMNT_0041924631 /DNA_START=984 /DNA_END=1289 /DNA_ORIENTATION=-